MSFGRPAAQVPEHLAKKRLKGLLERAALKEKGVVIESKKSNSGSAVGVESPDSDDDSHAIFESHKQLKPKSDSKNVARRAGERPNRNSLLPEATPNRWKRNAENGASVAPSAKRSKLESSDSSSSDEEPPPEQIRVKKEKGLTDGTSEPVVLFAEESSPSSEESMSETLFTKPSQENTVPLRTDAEANAGPGEEPDEMFFKPLGAETKIGKKIELVGGLPLWVKQAVHVSAKVEPCGDLEDDVDVLGKSLVRLLRSDGITGLFPMQKQVIRELLDPRYVIMGLPPRDICVAAPTGSGKTLAYVLPLIKLLKGLFEKAIRAVILLPTSELAKQVHDVFMHYAQPFQLSAALLTGLKSHSEEVKILLDRGHPIVDVVIATPKTFLKHLRLTPGFSLRLVSHLVLDEADRMVDMVIHGLIREVEDAIYLDDPTRCRCTEIGAFERSRPSAISCCTMDAPSLPLRKLLYSATLMSDPEKLRHVNLFYPRVFHAKADHTVQTNRAFVLPSTLEEYKLFCDISVRPLVVWWLSVHNKMGRMIVFARSREECHRLRVVIEFMGNCKVADLSAEMKKRKRQRTLADFDNGLFDVLVCTNVLARGMDLKNVEHVILYHVPSSAEDYVHMVGRTARANQHGKSLVLLNIGENLKLTKTLKMISNSKPKELPWDQDKLEEFYGRYEEALASVPVLFRYSSFDNREMEPRSPVVCLHGWMNVSRSSSVVSRRRLDNISDVTETVRSPSVHRAITEKALPGWRPKVGDILRLPFPNYLTQIVVIRQPRAN